MFEVHQHLKWSLQAPSPRDVLHGFDTCELGPDRSQTHKLTSGRCFRLESLDAVISDFEDRARVIHSNWVFKPGADRNLIVPRNFSDPSLGRTAAKGKMRPLTDDQILQLLDCLDSVLEGVSLPKCIALAKANNLPSLTSRQELRTVSRQRLRQLLLCQLLAAQSYRVLQRNAPNQISYHAARWMEMSPKQPR